jgi:hypothetical protein
MTDSFATFSIFKQTSNNQANYIKRRRRKKKSIFRCSEHLLFFLLNDKQFSQVENIIFSLLFPSYLFLRLLAPLIKTRKSSIELRL